jgi:hypothetical protein
MVAGCNAPDVLLAYQPVGPNVRRLLQLVQKFPSTKFSTIADDADAIHALSKAFTQAGKTLEVLLDIDCGMHRCGVAPGPVALELYRLIAGASGLKPGGLHVYDGHLHDSDLSARTTACEAAFAPVAAFRQQLVQADLPVPTVVAGGTPTFPIHAAAGCRVQSRDLYFLGPWLRHETAGYGFPSGGIGFDPRDQQAGHKPPVSISATKRSPQRIRNHACTCSRSPRQRRLGTAKSI